MIEYSFHDYNEKRPHFSIAYLTPREFRRIFLNDQSFREEYLNSKSKKTEVEMNGI